MSPKYLNEYEFVPSMQLDRYSIDTQSDASVTIQSDASMTIYDVRLRISGRNEVDKSEGAMTRKKRQAQHG